MRNKASRAEVQTSSPGLISLQGHGRYLLWWTDAIHSYVVCPWPLSALIPLGGISQLTLLWRSLSVPNGSAKMRARLLSFVQGKGLAAHTKGLQYVAIGCIMRATCSNCSFRYQRMTTTSCLDICRLFLSALKAPAPASASCCGHTYPKMYVRDDMHEREATAYKATDNKALR